MSANDPFERYRELQRYVGWREDDARRVGQAGQLLQPRLGELVEDFYRAALGHPRTAEVLAGDAADVERLKRSLRGWLQELLQGPYDAAYVARRRQVGLRHVEIGLEQIYASAALSRLRSGMAARLAADWRDAPDALLATLESLNRLLDLDLAIIEDAYEGERLDRQRRQQQAEMDAALHEEKQFADRLFERAQAIVLVLNPAGRILRFNPYLEQLTGVRLSQVRGEDWFTRFVPAEERERSLRQLLEGNRDGDTGSAIHTIRSAAGLPRTISWSSTALNAYDGHTVAVLIVGHDITELQEAQQRALQAERLAAIGQMITGLAHESRNALQRIQACAEMLELELEEQPESLDLVRRIQLAQDQMHRLYEEVRGYAAPIKLERDPLGMPDVWREAWELLAQQRSGRQAVLRERSEGPPPTVAGDRFRLVQVFRNLLENSLAACQDPVEVLVECREARLQDRLAVEISIQDNGPGMDQQQRERIFQPFFTTKTKGTGLGMSIAQRIVEAHGGQIRVGRSDEHGTEIIITLPRQG